MGSRPGKLHRAALLATASTLTLTACASGGNGDPNTVVYWDTSAGKEHTVFTEIARKCADQGGYRVQVEEVAFDQALNNYKTAAQGGQGPDVLRADVGWVPQLAAAGLIQDLSGTPLADTSAYLDNAAASTRYQGKPYGVPQVTDTLALFYNKRQLTEANVEPPRTWDELIRIAPRLGGERALFLNNDDFYALPFVYTAGGDLVDSETKEITVNSPETVRGLATAKRLLDTGSARTAQDPSNSYSTMKAAFSSGEVAMMIDGPWVIPEILASDEFSDPSNLGIAPIPGPERTAPPGGHDYVLRQGSDSTAASTKFVQCMSSTENQAEVAKRIGLLPTREDAYDDPAVADQPIVSAFTPLVRNTHKRAWIPEGDELIDGLRSTYADILAGNKTPRAAADELAKTYQDTVVPDYTQR